MDYGINSSKERKVFYELEHRKMLDEIANRLLNNISDCSLPQEIERFKLYYKAPIPDLLKVLSDIEGQNLYFVNYSPITGEPLVAKYGNWLVHIARVNRVNYVIYPDWTHSKWIRGNINRIYVNEKRELVVDNNGKEVTVKKQDKK